MAFHKEFLKDRRVYCGFSQEEFAKRVGVCKQAVQKWESGVAIPRPARLKKISEVLNSRIAEFSDFRVADTGNFLSGDGDTSAIEAFRSGLIAQFIQSEIPPESLKTALQIIQNFKLENDKK